MQEKKKKDSYDLYFKLDTNSLPKEEFSSL